MRRSISLLWGCLALGWSVPVSASEGPAVQRPSQSAVVEPSPVEPPPIPVTPAPVPPPPFIPASIKSELPSYVVPVVVDDEPAPIQRPRDPQSETMIIAGSVLFCAGFPVTMLSALKLHEELVLGFSWQPHLQLSKVGLGVGLAFIATGATLLGAGVTRHKRWKKSLGGPARVQLQPMIGFTQIGIVGRF
jgi:hypothetical protein